MRSIKTINIKLKFITIFFNTSIQYPSNRRFHLIPTKESKISSFFGHSYLNISYANQNIAKMEIS